MSVTLLPLAESPSLRRHRPATRMTAEAAALANRLSRPREPFLATLEGSPLSLAVVGLATEAPPEIAEAATLVVAIGDERVAVRLPAAIVNRLARAVQGDLAALPAAPTGALLIELALAPLLDAAERRLERALRVESVGASGAPPAGASLLIEARLADEPFPLQIAFGRGPADRPLSEACEAVLALAETLPAKAASVSALPLPLAFVAGHTRLSLGQLEGLRVGDAVLPDRWHPAGGEILVRLGEAQAATATTDRHTSTLKTSFRPAAQVPAAAREDMGMGQKTGQETTAGAAAPPSLDEAALDAVDVTLRFELGRRSLGIGELKGIGAGHVFDLGLDPSEPVDLVANGVRIGAGEIVEIGERIGIRVVRLFGRD